MMERLFRHCRDSKEGAGLPMGCPDKRLLERASDGGSRDGLKPGAGLSGGR